MEVIPMLVRHENEVDAIEWRTGTLQSHTRRVARHSVALFVFSEESIDQHLARA